MNARLTHHAAALALALATTLAIFSGVSHLSSPSHAGQLLAQQHSSPAKA